MKTNQERAVQLQSFGYGYRCIAEHMLDEGRDVILAEVKAWTESRRAPVCVSFNGTRMPLVSACRKIRIGLKAAQAKLKIGMTFDEIASRHAAWIAHPINRGRFER